MMRTKSRIRATMHISLAGEEQFWGPGVAQLLHAVRAQHSLRAAAADMQISYSKAWRIIHEAEAALGFPLVWSRTGGAFGGGSYLTDKGEQLLRSYDNMVSDMEGALYTSFDKYMLPLFLEEDKQ